MRTWVVFSLFCLLAFVTIAAACEGASGTPSGGSCSDWCTKMVSACPSDQGGDTQSTCEVSCNHASGGVSSAAMSCASSAQTCNDTYACWAFLYPSTGDTSSGSSSDTVQ